MEIKAYCPEKPIAKEDIKKEMKKYVGKNIWEQTEAQHIKIYEMLHKQL